MRYDYADLQILQDRARRARAEAVHRMLIAPLLALFRRGRSHERGLTPIRMAGCSSRAS
jgi:hypothetical protein